MFTKCLSGLGEGELPGNKPIVKCSETNEMQLTANINKAKPTASLSRLVSAFIA